MKLKCNYYISVRGGEEHRNLIRQYGSETSGAVNCGDKSVYFAPGTPLSFLESQKLFAVAYLAADTPLSVHPGESQTLSAVAAGHSVAHDELYLLPCLLLFS